MDTNVITAIAASVTTLVAIVGVFIGYSHLKKQLTHTADKDWFITFTKLVAELSSATYSINRYIDKQSDSTVDMTDSAFISLKATLTVIRLMLNQSSKLENEIILRSTIDKFLEQKSVPSKTDLLKKLDIILKRSIEVAKVAKQKLYLN